jgi:hypothetical protein
MAFDGIEFSDTRFIKDGETGKFPKDNKEKTLQIKYLSQFFKCSILSKRGKAMLKEYILAIKELVCTSIFTYSL